MLGDERCWSLQLGVWDIQSAHLLNSDGRTLWDGNSALLHESKGFSHATADVIRENKVISASASRFRSLTGTSTSLRMPECTNQARSQDNWL